LNRRILEKTSLSNKKEQKAGWFNQDIVTSGQDTIRGDHDQLARSLGDKRKKKKKKEKNTRKKEKEKPQAAPSLLKTTVASTFERTCLHSGAPFIIY